MNHTCSVNTVFLRNKTFAYIYNLQIYNFYQHCNGLQEPQTLMGTEITYIRLECKKSGQFIDKRIYI
jgi:hypothetical protein